MAASLLGLRAMIVGVVVALAQSSGDLMPTGISDPCDVEHVSGKPPESTSVMAEISAVDISKADQFSDTVHESIVRPESIGELVHNAGIGVSFPIEGGGTAR